MVFELWVFRFEFRTLDSVSLPPGKSGNIFRGALGDLLRRVACRPDCPGAKSCPYRSDCAYARFFEPVLDAGPSGLADPPRPFVLRPRFIEGRTLPPGSKLTLDLHVFDVRTSFLPYVIAALWQLAKAGIGPGRGRAALERVFEVDGAGRSASLVYSGGRFVTDRLPEPLRLSLADDPVPVDRVCLRFLTPTELKNEGRAVDRPEFGVLISRLRDRIATLDQLYGSGTVSFDWKGLAEAASAVQIATSDLRTEQVERLSTRTGQVHPIGGFTGTVEYEGRIEQFMPLLRAGQWIGVGRQTVWGKGAYKIQQTNVNAT